MAYTPPAGNLVALPMAGAYTPPAGNLVALPMRDPGPGPDPDPEVPTRWVGSAASLPWRAAPRRARSVRSSYGNAVQVRQRAGLPWSAAPRRAARLITRWGALPTIGVSAWSAWSSAPHLGTPTIGLPWMRLPVATTAASLPWSTQPRATTSASLPWTAPPRLEVAVALPWTTPPRVSTSAEIPWTAPPEITRRWELPWGHAQRVRWRVRSPDVDPPDPETPWGYEPPQGNRVPVAFLCPQLDHPGNQVPVPFGPAACYFAWPRPRRYIVLNSAAVVRLPERTPIPVSAISLTSTVDDAMWTVGMTLADPASLAYLLPDAGGAKAVEININGHVWTALIESHSRNRRFPSTSITVSGRSRTAALDAPYASTRAAMSTLEMQAQSLAEAELDLTGITLDWDTLTWLVPAGAWSYDGLTPIAAVRKAAEAAGAVVQSDPWDLVLHVRARYPVSPWAWSTAAPDKTIPDDLILEDSLRVVSKPVHNYVLVSGDHVGVSDPIIREGSAGDVRAPMVVDPLITTHDVAAERGRNVLSDRGEQAMIDVTIPLFPSSASDMPGLVLPLHLVRVIEPVAWKALAVAVTIDARMQDGGNGAQALVIDQRITLERHYTDAG